MTSGLTILDVRARGLERLGVQVTDVESGRGSVRFMARSVEERVDANQTFPLRHPQPHAVAGLSAFVDVDDTLVRSVGSKRIPMSEVIRRVRELHSGGARLYCWSTAGAVYAHDTAAELDIAHCFFGFLDKPHVMIDDQTPSAWRNLVCLHPNEIASMSLSEIQALAGRSAG
jgi:hypothetical protein